MWNIIVWAGLGLVAGAIAKMIYPGTQGGGIFATIALGITGAFVGGFLHTFIMTGKLALTAVSGFSIYSVIFAVLGSMVVIFLWGLVTRNA
jgi:uncharacterized membrane protein YeaQ/YmgE (transglycosylase-associated protein family)